MHPDQMYELRQLRHSDLREETQQVRARRAFTSGRSTRGRGWLVTWLRRLSTRHTHGAMLTDRADEAYPRYSALRRHLTQASNEVEGTGGHHGTDNRYQQRVRG